MFCILSRLYTSAVVGMYHIIFQDLGLKEFNGMSQSLRDIRHVKRYKKSSMCCILREWYFYQKHNDVIIFSMLGVIQKLQLFEQDHRQQRFLSKSAVFFIFQVVFQKLRLSLQNIRLTMISSVFQLMLPSKLHQAGEFCNQFIFKPGKPDGKKVSATSG